MPRTKKTGQEAVSTETEIVWGKARKKPIEVEYKLSEDNFIDLRYKDGTLYKSPKEVFEKEYEILEEPSIKFPKQPLDFDVEIIRGRSNQVTFFEALKLIPEGKRLITNKECDMILQNKEELEKHKDLFDCWADPTLIYEASDKPFGEFIKTPYFIMDIPKQFQGMKNVALAISSSHYKFQDDKYGNKFIRPEEDKIKLIQNFPSNNGWYNTDPETGVPYGQEISSSNPEARYLYRRSEAWIGPLVRYYDGFYVDVRRYVYCDGGPDGARGVGVVETSSKEVSSRTKASSK